MLSHIDSIGLYGMQAYTIAVEADLSRGLPSFDIVGLPDASVREARNRIHAAIQNCGFQFPVNRITINLAPADLHKSGAIYDLPILLALLVASEQLPAECCHNNIFLGEVSLSGKLRPVRGVLSMALYAKASGFGQLYVPAENAAEGAVVKGLSVFPVTDLLQLFAHLSGKKPIASVQPSSVQTEKQETFSDFADVCGQEGVKRALEIAACGGHNLLMIGSPGSGKSMLAKRFSSILPAMTMEEKIEVTQVHSVAGILPPGGSLLSVRPFCAPHHTISRAGLTGGGALPKPGEISLAHNGVLFLDELPEFSHNTIESLRQPMEDGTVSIVRTSGSAVFPCRFLLLAAMNPCPCGYFGHPTKPCVCSENTVSRYLSRISGPLLDRFDLHVDVPPVAFELLDSGKKAEASSEIQKRVNLVRQRQTARFAGTGISCNARITSGSLHEICRLHDDARTLIKNAFDALGLSARAYDRILKVARTIADLDHSELILSRHAAEAIQYRSLDRKYWVRHL